MKKKQEMKYKQMANNKMTVVSPFKVIITLNVKMLDSWIKRQSGKTRPNYMLPIGDLFQV